MSASKKRSVDDKGKQRVKEHQLGNWPTHVFIPIEAKELLELQERLRKEFEVIDVEAWKQDLHHSLSKTVYPKTHQVNPLLDSLEANLASVKRLSLGYNTELEVYANDIGSRFFLCINCTEDSNKALSRLSALVDESLADFGLETFYTGPRFHVSLLWAPTDVFTEHLNQLADILPEEIGPLEATAILLRAGNKERRKSLWGAPK